MTFRTARFTCLSFALATAACGDAEGEPIVTTANSSGSSGGGATTSSAGGGDASSSSAGGMGAGGMTGAGGSATGGGDPAVRPRLLVAHAGGVAIWDRADELTADVMPDHDLGGFSGQGLALAADGDRLFAASSGNARSVYIYDGLDALDGASTSPNGIPPSSFNGAINEVWDLHVAGGDNLVITSSEDIGSTRMFPMASTLTTGGMSPARFTHGFQQLRDAVYVPSVDRLFATQVSGAGLIAYDDASSATGDQDLSWALEPGAFVWSAAFHQGDLYASANTELKIWRNIASISSTQAPDVVLDQAGSQLTGVLYFSFQGDTLVVTNKDNVEPKVQLFFNASTLSSGAAPDVTIPLNGLPDDAVLDQTGHLYVRYDEQVLIFSDATTTPTFQASLDIHLSGVNDILLIE